MPPQTVNLPAALTHWTYRKLFVHILIPVFLFFQRNLMVTRNASNVVQREELQITIMLISVIIVFFICQAPYVIYTALASISKYRVSQLI